ncbi:unnamed protein product [Clonostachys rosea]|uniref:Formin GTPase-binding domain-containing protein n=1 Tax=Bionectria ochroleuca TaxID=29856 RepID=A0ABY6UNW1_BIOOC|nr:unnamed protein product [Clonostachys rosea]
MGPSSKNSSITSFFKPVQQQAPQIPSSPAKSVVASPSTAPSSSPIVQASINVEIAASDDDDDDGAQNSKNDLSDDEDELEDFMAKFNPRKSAPQTPPRKSFQTPGSKRTMTGHSSPSLSSDSRPQFLFDMKALLRDSLQDEAINNSFIKANESREESRPGQPAEDGFDKDQVFMNVVKDQGGQNAHKILRAVQRAEDSGPKRPRFFFFEAFETPRSAPKPPRGIKSGPWRLLAHEDDQTREQFLASGLPITLALKGKTLPEELFQWVLDDFCCSKSILVREEYCRLLSIHTTHIETLITIERLDQLFYKLGCIEIPRLKQEVLETSMSAEDSYARRDWSNLRSLLELLSVLSGSLSAPALNHAIQMLLKMSIDKFLICNLDLVVEYGRTIEALLGSLPDASWSSFCLETTKLLFTGFTINSLRLNSLLCLPLSNEKARNLRRRLATAFFFNDPNLGDREPAEIVTVERCINRLKEPDLSVTRKTDFEELKAKIIFLDIAIASGSFSPFENAENEKIFNEQVDELAGILAALTRKINDSGMKLSRAEAKSVIEWIQKRISLSIRTKRQRKADIFQTLDRAEDPSIPQQRAYMQNFLKKA